MSVIKKFKELIAQCGYRALLALFGGFLMHMTIGSIYTFANFSPYFISYLKNRTADTDIKNIDGVWVGGVATIGNIIGMFAGGILDSHFGPRVATFIGSVIFSGSVAATYFTVQYRFIALCMTYGLLMDVGNKIVYGVPLQSAMKWFPRHQTLAVGLTMAGFGGSATVFNQIITSFINPDNLSPDYITEDGERYFTDPDLLDRVPYCFLLLGVIYICLGIIGALCLSNPPTNNDQLTVSSGKPDHYTKSPVVVTAIKPIADDNSCYVISVPNERIKRLPCNVKDQYMEKREKEIEPESPVVVIEMKSNRQEAMDDLTHTEAIKLAFKSRCFYIIFIAVLFVPTGMNWVGMFYKAFGQRFIPDDRFLSVVGSLASVFNCLGRPMWGIIMDRYGYKRTMFTITGGLIVLYASLRFTETLPRGLFLLWVCAIYLFYCGNWAVLPATMAKLFGVNHMAVNYAFIQIAYSISSLTGSIIASNLEPQIGWHGMFYLAAGCVFIPFLLTFIFNGRDRFGKRI